MRSWPLAMCRAYTLSLATRLRGEAVNMFERFEDASHVNRRSRLCVQPAIFRVASAMFSTAVAIFSKQRD